MNRAWAEISPRPGPVAKSVEAGAAMQRSARPRHGHRGSGGGGGTAADGAVAARPALGLHGEH
jgi:hypothetical protein